MSLERRDSLVVNLFDLLSLSLEPDAKMHDGMKVETHDLLVVAEIEQFLAVLIDKIANC